MSDSKADKKDKSEEDEKVEIFHRVNKLKMKAGADMHAGAGYIDKNAIERAQTVIETKESLYVDEIRAVLTNLSLTWEKVIGDDAEKAKEGAEELYHYANHVKDLAATFGYELMDHFGVSLREFAEKIDVKNDKHLTIGQAHIDVMWVAYHENIKDHGGPTAEELKKIVAKAIEKYS